jgi:hypothetical protein
MSNSFEAKASAYDKYGLIKLEIDKAIGLLKDFRAKYPFTENPQLIDSLQLDDIFKEDTDEIGEFFHYVEVYLKPIGHLTLYSNVYRNVRAQIEDFKDLLYVTVDKKKSIAQKVDAHWEEISGLGLDKHIAKKIIYCFNYENGEMLPIFKTAHLRHFVKSIVEARTFPANYTTLGEEYEYLTDELLNTKNGFQLTESWEMPYFSRFLYDTFPPPDKDTPQLDSTAENRPKHDPTSEQLKMGEFMRLLGELQSKRRISGQQFREYRDMWSNQLLERESLYQRLKKLLD